MYSGAGDRRAGTSRRSPPPASTPSAPTRSRPRWLLDLAADHGLRVMVGLPWEQHVDLPRRRRARAEPSSARCGGGRARAPGTRRCSCYAIGNEIPAPIVRWHGAPRRSSASCERLYDAAKDDDPGALVTYVNYPTTEYLELPFLDFVCFNVYLESQRAARGLPRAPAEPRRRPPLVMARDRARQPAQRRRARRRESLDWQIAHRVRGGVRRRVRLRVDRRVAPRRRTTSRTGTSASPTASAQPKPALARGPRRVRARLPFPPGPRVAARSRSSSAATTARARSATRCDGLDRARVPATTR